MTSLPKRLSVRLRTKWLWVPMPLQSLQDMLFHKRDIERYPLLVFNDTKVQMAASWKHFGLIFDIKLDFDKHINSKILKKIIGI